MTLLISGVWLMGSGASAALSETNIAPKNVWLEYYFPIGEAYFQMQNVSFRVGRSQNFARNILQFSAGHRSIVPSLRNSHWIGRVLDVIGWEMLSYPPSQDAIVTTRITNHF